MQQRNTQPPSSGLKSKLSKKSATSTQQAELCSSMLLANFLLAYSSILKMDEITFS
jgi:hypothetical protein